MKIRDYVDELQGKGSWDSMHDLIGAGQIRGWTMPTIDVDGRSVDIFPGRNREVTLEAVIAAARSALAQIPPSAIME
jgi:hypothetical protein